VSKKKFSGFAIAAVALCVAFIIAANIGIDTGLSGR
jgi:hypothetical protein